MTVRARSLRDVATVATAVSAGVHAALAPEHWRERPLLGVGFAVAAAALAATTVLLQTSPSTLPVLAALPLLSGLCVVYLLSRTYGFPVTGREEWDAVGIATQAVQLIGLGAAIALSPTPTRGGTYADPASA